MSGRIRDVVVDIRVDSPTFGRWEAVELSADNRKGVLLPAGVGHVFVALDDNSTVCYLVSDVYTPDRDHGIHPLDPTLAIDYTLSSEALLLSAKDQAAPTLAEALASGALPHIDQKEPAK